MSYTNVVWCEKFLVEIGNTSCNTNVIRCAVKILHSEQNPGPSAAPNFFYGEWNAFFLSFLFLFPTLCCVAPRVGMVHHFDSRHASSARLSALCVKAEEKEMVVNW